MLRLVGFFFATIVLLSVFRTVFAGVPVLGWIFGTSLLGFWVTAILLSVGLSRLSAEAIDRRKRTNLVRSLGAVETPHNLGKLGSLFVSQGRHARGLPYLDKAVVGEPEVAEWHYRRGLALQHLRRADEALDALDRALVIDDEYGYGAARMAKARCELALGRHGAALDSLTTFERFHGPSPESAYRRGKMLRQLGRRAEASAAFDEVTELARQSARYQRKSSTGWAWRARLAKLG
ncbi:MAG: tetratricopeptide repeat protein [Planctomycetota bacterium]|nr:tetratricopeptide repeat protein [Planctomycetota bacterium]